MNRGVLWDLDGTLVDSEEFHWQSWEHALGLDGVRVTHEQFKATFGQRNDRILRNGSYGSRPTAGGRRLHHRRRGRTSR
jgi:beta-phosphoglucomutase